MVGKNNYQKTMKTNLQEHHKAYKVGKRWVYASISSLAFGSMLFFSGQLTSLAATTPVAEATTTATEGNSANSSTATLKSTASSTSTAIDSSAVASQETPTSSTAPTSSASQANSDLNDTPTSSTAKKTTLNNPTDSELAAAKTSAAAIYATTGQPQEVAAIAAPSVDKISITGTGDSVGYQLTPSGGLGLTFSYSGINAGDVIKITIPTELDLLGFDWGGVQVLSSATGKTSYVRNADGTTTVTNEYTAGVSGISIQEINLVTYLNTGNVPISADQVGKTITKSVTTTINGVADASYDITQYYQPTVTIPTAPARTDVKTVTKLQPNTDYVYEFKLNDSTGFLNDSGTHRVATVLNTGGTEIKIPVPASFTLNADLTSKLNNFGLDDDQTTITQAGKGADIIITVPAGSGDPLTSGYPYYLAGSYDITQTNADQTVSAAGPATIVQNYTGGQLTATTTNDAVWTDTIAALNTTDTETSAVVTGTGNSNPGDHTVLAVGTTVNYVNQATISTTSAYDITDAEITLTVPDGVNATGVALPAANVAQTNKNLTGMAYLNGTTSYDYTLTYADGTTSTGTATVTEGDGTVVEADHDSPIRSIVLKPNHIAAGAGTFKFNIQGSLSTAYDDGSPINDGDKLTFTQSIVFPSNGNTPFSKTNVETVQAGVGLLQAYRYQSSNKPGEGKNSYISTKFNGSAGQTTDLIYEPILYYVLPTIATVKNIGFPKADLAAGVKVSYYTTDDGRTGVKIDYTGTGLSYDTHRSTPTYQITLNNFPIDAVAGNYAGWIYATSPTTPLENTDKVTDTSLTDGDANAISVGAIGFDIVTVKQSVAFAFAQGNQDTSEVTNGTSKDTGSSTMDYYVSMVNSLDNTTKDSAEIVNLPTVGDEAGSQYDFALSGPITLPTNFTNANDDGATMEGTKVLYSTSLYDVTNASGTPDLSSYLTADEVTDNGINWSDIHSVYFYIGGIPKDNSTGRIKIEGTVAQFPTQAGKTGYIDTMYFANGLVPAVQKQAASIAITGDSTVKVAFHYTDDSGVEHYIAVDDRSKTYTDNVDTMQTSDFPTSQAGFSATDIGLIPTNYRLKTNADGTLVYGIENSDVADYEGMPNGTAAFGAVAQYYFDGDTVVYELTNGKVAVNVNYVDDDNKGKVVKTDKIVDIPAKTVEYPVGLPAGYVLASGQDDPVEYTIPDDDSGFITIHLVHKLTPGTATSNYTVTYTGLPTDKAQTAKTGTLNWTTSKDEITKTVTYTPSSPTQTVESPSVAGYTPDKENVTFTFTADTTAPTAQTATVNYAADDQTTNIKYVDDDQSGAPVGDPTPLNGTTDATKTWNANVPDGYALAKGQKDTGTYTFSASSNPDIVIHLVHVHEAGTATSTYTVKTAGLPATKAIPDDMKTENWTTDTDKVTNDVTYTPTDKTIDVTPTEVDGYSVTPASHTFTFTEDTAAPTDQEFTFEYSADPQTLTINYVDVSTGKQVGTDTKDGTTDESVKYTADQVPANYVLAKGQAATGTKTLTTDPAKNVVVINVAPSVGHTTKTTKQTVKYLLQGTETPLHAETTQVVTWNVSSNDVTGDVIATPQGLYAETTAPVIAGYTPTTGSVPLDKLVAGTTLPEDTSATIFYTADGQSLAITYIDDSTHTTVASDSVPGKTNESVKYTADKIPANYVLAIGQAANGSQTLSADATKNTVIIHVVPAVAHTTQNTTQTVNYVAAGTTHALKDPTTQTITWNISTNAVTGEVVATPQGAYAATKAPTIAGYTPDKTSVAATAPTVSTKLPENTSDTINYKADPQTLTITYLDDSTKTSVGNDSVDGVTDQVVSYTADKVPANYTLATGQAASGKQTLSADATKNTVTIHVVPVVNHTTKDTTQTVNYVVSGTDKALMDPTTQTITWNISTNAVTGEIIATPQAGYAATTAPTITGYTPDRKTVAANNPAPSTTMPKDSTEIINYKADGQTLTINYVDDSTHTNVGTDTATGVTNGTVAYKADKVPANYVLANDQAASGTQTLSADPTKNVVTIHVVPAVAHTTQTTTQTVNYVLAGTTTTMQDPTTQQITWNISTNQVTGEMVATPQGGYAATTAPTIAGYTPDKTSVAADNPVALTTLPKDSSATISYTADPQTLTINYVDGATGKTVATDTVPGTTDEVVNYTADKVPANYVLANGQGTTGTQTLTADPTKNVATIKVVPAVTHGTQVTTQTVNYVLAGTTTALKTPTTQQITWNISTDQVTGDIIATPQGGYAATTAPTIAGYTPDKTSVAADKPVAMTTLPEDSSATISYTADPQTLTVAYIDDVTGATISTDTATGVTDQTGTYTVTVPANYELATGQADTVAYTLNADSAKNNVEVHLTHHISHTTTTTTRTINYLVKGSDAQVTDPDVQTITWNVSTDDVTNASVATPQDGYAEVTAPTITGYTADTPVVAAENPAPTSADQLAAETVTVYYTVAETDDNGEGDNGNGTPTQPTDEGNPTSTGNETATPTDTNNGQITVPTETGTSTGTQAVKVTGTQQTKATANKLPQTDEKANTMALIGLGLMSFMSFMGLARTKKHD